MDILIKNMNLPKKGETRYLLIDGDGYAGIWNEGNKGFVYSHEAIPVPKHGRLIDADALYKIVSSMDKCSMSKVLEYILDAQTVLEANNGHTN